MDAYEALESARSAHETGDLEAAAMMYSRALRLAYHPRDSIATDAHRGRVQVLLEQDRAETALHLAISAWAPDAPAAHVWAILDVVRALPDAKGEKILTRHRIASRGEMWNLLSASSELAKDGHHRSAAALVRDVIRVATEAQDNLNRWRAEAQLGYVYELAGDVDAALTLWRKAFDEGSPNRRLADRLSLHTFKKGEYAECCRVCEAAIERISDNRVIATLSKRLTRARSHLL